MQVEQQKTNEQKGRQSNWRMVREQKKWENHNQKCREAAEANAKGSKTEKQPRRITQG